MKLSKYKKRIILIVSLIIVILGTTIIIQELFCHPSNFDEDRIAFFHEEPKNSLDVVVMGSSDIYAGFSSAYAYEENGITSYPYALSGATIVAWKTMLEDILQTQNPQIVVVEVFGACYDDNVVMQRSSQAMKLMDNIPFSARKIRNAVEMAAYSNNVKWTDYLFPFVKYHNFYGGYLRNLRNRMGIKSIGASPLKGISNITRVSHPQKVHDASCDKEKLPLGSISEECLRKFLEYCKTKKVNMLFVRYPQFFAEKGEDQYRSMLRANSVGEIVNEYGYPFINLQYEYDTMGIDTYADFYNRGHLNVFGQKKATSYICNYLINNKLVKLQEKDSKIKKEWSTAVDYYEEYYNLNVKQIKAGVVEELGDSPEFVRRIKERIK